jgi:hypothetical protein
MSESKGVVATTDSAGLSEAALLSRVKELGIPEGRLEYYWIAEQSLGEAPPVESVDGGEPLEPLNLDYYRQLYGILTTDSKSPRNGVTASQPEIIGVDNQKLTQEMSQNQVLQMLSSAPCISEKCLFRRLPSPAKHGSL